jgi:alditol oxidase
MLAAASFFQNRTQKGCGMTREMNWAGNVQYGASRVMHPVSLEELQAVVATNELVRPLGSRHSFSTVADSEGILVSLASLPRRVEVDATAKTATVAAGMTYGEVAIELHRQGWGLHNLASLGHIAVAGACATATHGSGDRNKCLSSAVRAMTVVDSQGELCELAPHLDGARFSATQAGLGGVGIVVSASLAVEPTYDVAQRAYLDLPFATFVANYEEILASAYSVSLFSDYRAPRFTQVWRKQRVSPGEQLEWPDPWFGAVGATHPVHPVPGMSPDATTRQGGDVGPWHERLPHFRLDHTPSSGEEIQSEYLVAREHAAPVLEALADIASSIAPVLLISEVRSVAADDVWLSPAYDRDTVAFHFTWRRDPPAVLDALTQIERQIRPFDARPHWGKVHRFSPEQLLRAYPRLPSYLEQRRRLDPSGVFSNDFLESLARAK